MYSFGSDHQGHQGCFEDPAIPARDDLRDRQRPSGSRESPAEWSGFGLARNGDRGVVR